MSQFTGGNADAAMRRNRNAGGIARLGVDATPNAPGLEIMPAVSSSATQLSQLAGVMDSFYGAGRALSGFYGQIAQDNRNELARNERNQQLSEMERDRLIAKNEREMEKANNAAEAIARTTAKGQARRDLSLILQKAREGDPNALMSQAQSPEELQLALDELVDRNTSGLPESAREAYRSSFVPTALSGISRVRENIGKGAREELLASVSEGLAATTDQTEAIQSLTQVRSQFSTLSDREFYSSTVLPALNSAAERGDEAQFNVLRSTLTTMSGTPNFLKLDVENAQAKLTQSVIRNNSEASRRISDQFRLALADESTSITKLREMYKTGVESGAIKGEQITSFDNMIESEAQRRSSEAQKQVVLAEKNAFRMQAISDAANSIVSFSPLDPSQEFTVKLSDGKEEKITGAEARDEAFKYLFNQIDQAPSLTPEAKVATQVDLAWKNGYTPPEWKQRIETAYVVASGEGEIPANMVPSIQRNVTLFASVRRANDAAARKLTGDDAYHFYSSIEDSLNRGESIGVAITAARMAQRRPIDGESISAAIRAAQPSASLRTAFESENVTRGVVRDFIYEEAYRLNQRGIAPGEAVKRADKMLEESSVKVNDSLLIVPFGYSPAAREALPAFGKSVAESLVTSGVIDKTDEVIFVADRRSGAIRAVSPDGTPYMSKDGRVYEYEQDDVTAFANREAQRKRNAAMVGGVVKAQAKTLNRTANDKFYKELIEGAP